MRTQAGKKSKMGRRKKKKKLLNVRYENAGNSHKPLSRSLAQNSPPLPNFFIYFIKHAVASSYIPSLSFFSKKILSLNYMCSTKTTYKWKEERKKINLIEESIFICDSISPKKKQATSDCNHPHKVYTYMKRGSMTENRISIPCSFLFSPVVFFQFLFRGEIL